MITKLIPYLFSCPTHLLGILNPKKVVEKDNNKKKHPFHINYDFHAHLVGTNLNTQESNMFGKMMQLLPFIYAKETYRLSKYSQFISMKSVKNKKSSNNCRRLYSFAFILNELKKTEGSESSEFYPYLFQCCFACSHLSTILDRNLEADLQLFCISQIIVIVIFVPTMNISLFGKR